MSASSGNPEEIWALDTAAGIRSRPTMYLPDFGRPHVVNSLLQECLCISLDNALEGCATEIRITLANNGSIAVWDNGPPLPLKGRDGLPVIQTLLTRIHACRNAKRRFHNELCSVGIVVANAASEWLHVDCGLDGRHYRQVYQRGLPAGPFVDVGSAHGIWEQITFLPDVSFLGKTVLDIPAFQAWFSRQHFAIPNCSVTLFDEQDGHQFKLA